MCNHARKATDTAKPSAGRTERQRSSQPAGGEHGGARLPPRPGPGKAARAGSPREAGARGRAPRRSGRERGRWREGASGGASRTPPRGRGAGHSPRQWGSAQTTPEFYLRIFQRASSHSRQTRSARSLRNPRPCPLRACALRAPLRPRPVAGARAHSLPTRAGWDPRWGSDEPGVSEEGAEGQRVRVLSPASGRAEFSAQEACYAPLLRKAVLEPSSSDTRAGGGRHRS